METRTAGFALICGEHEYAVDVFDSAGVFVDDVPYEGGDLLLLRGVGGGDGGVCVVSDTGDEGRGHR